MAIGIVFISPILLLPPLADVRDDPLGTGLADVVEVPAGSGRYYDVAYVDDLGKGFLNEHRGAVLVKSHTLSWPFPIP